MKSKEITVLDQEIHINKNDYFSLKMKPDTIILHYPLKNG